jgi:hypothetical protein
MARFAVHIETTPDRPARKAAGLFCTLAARDSGDVRVIMI